MAHIILTGATGQAAAILAHALASQSISKISILSRRPVKLAEAQPSKINVVIHNDYEHYPQDILDQLKGASGCIWAQGISSVGVKEDDYRKITVDYPLAAARAFAGLNDGSNLNFIYVSGEGVNWDNKGQMYARVKGEAERELLGIDSPGLSVYNLRLLPVLPARRARKQHCMGKVLGLRLEKL